MSLHADLLSQAEQLAGLDLRRPKQASLRRAVSSAYYALFHLLTSEASAIYAAEPGLAARINRTLSHGEMKKASSMIANDKLPKSVQPPGGGYSTPADLKVVANAFVSLQERGTGRTTICRGRSADRRPLPLCDRRDKRSRHGSGSGGPTTRGCTLPAFSSGSVGTMNRGDWGGRARGRKLGAGGELSDREDRGRGEDSGTSTGRRTSHHERDRR